MEARKGIITIYDVDRDEVFYLRISKNENCTLGSDTTHIIQVSQGQVNYTDILIKGNYSKCYYYFKKILNCDEHEIIETIKKIFKKSNKCYMTPYILMLMNCKNINFKYE